MSRKSIELKIPVPYGDLSAKAWGNASNPSIKMLALHGWQDNASSFDKLIPLLNLEQIYVIALDFPGHGLSSHLQPGFPYTELTWVLEVKRVVDYLKWSKLSFLGHSMGANTALHFALLFPSQVEKIISIDSYAPPISRSEDTAELTREEIRNFVKVVQLNESQKPSEQVVSYARAINTMISAHSSICEISNDVAKCLLKRAVTVVQKGVNKGVIFNGDYRLATMIIRKFDAKMILDYFSGSIKCEFLLILAKNGLKSNKQFEQQFFDLYAKSCSKFSLVEEDGDHYIHIVYPQVVAGHVNAFLK